MELYLTAFLMGSYLFIYFMSLKVLVFCVFHGFAMFSLDEIAGTDPVKKQQKKEEYGSKV